VLADGLHSPLRSAAGLAGDPTSRPRIGLRAHFRLPDGREPSPWVDVFLGDRRRELYVTPLPERTLLVAALAGQGAMSGRPEEAFRAWLASEPAMGPLLDGAEAVSPVIGVAPLENRPRAGVAPGLALLGDAAGFIDPITGGGMAQALLSAELLARWVPGILADPTGRRLVAFDAARRAMLRDYRFVTRAVIGLADHPALSRATLGLLQACPSLFSHLLGVNSGCKPIWRLW
jgi:flavin-dependent dehydrogenase